MEAIEPSHGGIDAMTHISHRLFGRSSARSIRCHPASAAGMLALALAAGPALIGAGAAQAGPVVCTTSVEAPDMDSLRSYGVAPVEVTRSAPVVTVPQVMRASYYSYRSPYARGVDITHQITDVLGIAMGGVEGNRVMGFGFPDQAIVWDGSAVENTYRQLMPTQHDPTPWRTADLSTPFSTSLGGGAADGLSPRPLPPGYTSSVRGLW